MTWMRARLASFELEDTGIRIASVRGGSHHAILLGSGTEAGDAFLQLKGEHGAARQGRNRQDPADLLVALEIPDQAQVVAGVVDAGEDDLDRLGTGLRPWRSPPATSAPLAMARRASPSLLELRAVTRPLSTKIQSAFQPLPARWSLPISCIGGLWSWRCGRRHR